MLTLFLLMSIYFSITKKKWAFVLAATGLVFTKETGVILLFILFVNFVITKYNKSELTTFIKSTWIYVIPIALNFLFYFHQFYVQGWFLFPRHTGFISSEADHILNQFNRYFAKLFIYDGRNITFFTMLIFVIIAGILKWKAIKKITLDHTVLLLISLIAGFLIFSAFNFYSDRYILCLFPVFGILASLSITAVFKDRIWISSALGLVLAIITLTKSYTNTNPTDHSLGYSNAVRSQLSAINYCVNMDWQNKSIETHFLMAKNLTSHYPRYITQNQLFSAVNKAHPSPELIILSSNEQEKRLMENINDFYSVKRFEYGNEWCEIFARKKDR
jgi:4-amino-4-deoxy-L-arabinose transferase-like glycosyltransferase